MMNKLFAVLSLWMMTGAQAQEPISTVEPTTIDPLKLLSEVRQDLSGLEAAFIQYELIEGNEKADLNAGRVWMQSPAQFRWHYLNPIEQLIVADGKQVWIYDEDLEQVTVKTQSNQLNPIYVIINDDKSQQHYNIKHEVQSQGVNWISLTPKIANDEVKTVWLAIEKSLVTQIKVVNNFSQTMVFEFSDIKKNPDFKAGFFEFVPPEGVDVVRAIADDVSDEL
ncbi:Outer membrane lipoprotein carrier protein LolA [hydrothermal vent metagenome]|uniref:Outer-membrane lipoprotein carrier protein n=1 Tax=hydrothermal vent metagenome TaxID=652676 RepID=A0A3B0VZF6_9ZZZZ